jgi:AcrR family transcriptional regulator
VTRRSGRRPGASGTREAILAAAQRQFAERGYDRASMRSIAAEAGVDQKLVAHFFGSKQQLFISAVELPFDPTSALPAVLAGDPETVGERLANLLVGLLEQPAARDRLVGFIRAAASEPRAATLLRDRLLRDFVDPASRTLGSETAGLRVALVHAQCLGLVLTRYIIGAEPLASLPPQAVAEAIGPALQLHLRGTLNLTDHRHRPKPPSNADA